MLRLRFYRVQHSNKDERGKGKDRVRGDEGG